MSQSQKDGMESVYLQNKISKALNIAFQYGQTDGAHHKAWVIDQMVRVLTGESYDHWIETYCYVDSEEVYDRDKGIAPEYGTYELYRK